MAAPLPAARGASRARRYAARSVTLIPKDPEEDAVTLDHD